MSSISQDGSSGAGKLEYLRQTITLARQSPPKPTNFRVGCVIVAQPEGEAAVAKVLSTGYTLELEGNTHAEQCALAKLAEQHGLSLSELSEALPAASNATLYTSLEPCGKRLSGNMPCVERIIMTRQGSAGGGIRKVIFGAKEPGTFVKDSKSCQRMTDAGLEWEYISDLEDEILRVATKGHNYTSKGTHAKSRIDDISDEERKRQDAMPRNPKKRMMGDV